MKIISLAIISVFAYSQASLAQTTCSAQNIFDNCLSMEDTYLKTCVDRDYPCLCKWHLAKLSCYDNCPNDPGKASQQGMKDTYCSIAETYNKPANASSTLVSSPLATVSMATVSMATATTSSVTETKSTSSASALNQQGMLTFTIAAGITAAFFL